MPDAPAQPDEIARIRDAYARRDATGAETRHAPGGAASRYIHEGRERELLRMLREAGLMPLGGKRVLDAGCGSGPLLRDFVRYGSEPTLLHGVDLLPSRVASAHNAAPAIAVAPADVSALPYRDGAFDIVLHIGVMSSIIDPAMRRRIAAELMRVLRPGGTLLWYDFMWNPRNRDVRGVRLADLRSLFPGRRIRARRVTLAPPLVRLCVSRAPWLCRALERIPLLRTHYVATIS